jgi:hypothetical protein
MRISRFFMATACPSEGEVANLAHLAHVVDRAPARDGSGLLQQREERLHRVGVAVHASTSISQRMRDLLTVS